MKNQTPTRIDYGKGLNGRSNDWIGLVLDQLDPADLLSVLLGGMFELLL